MKEMPYGLAVRRASRVERDCRGALAELRIPRTLLSRSLIGFRNYCRMIFGKQGGRRLCVSEIAGRSSCCR